MASTACFASPALSASKTGSAVRRDSRIARRSRVVVRCNANESKGDESIRSSRRVVLKGGAAMGASLASSAISLHPALAGEFASPEAMQLLNRAGEVSHTEEEWKQILGPDRYSILRKESTERPFTSPLNNEKRKGTFVCAGCGSDLFASETKYNSGTGWPSFYQALPGAVSEVPDYSIFFMPRTEVRCKKCQGHLGHVFDDGPAPTNLRYCMNGLAMQFTPSADESTA